VVQRRDRCADERTHPEDPLHQRTKLCTCQFPINPGLLELFQIHCKIYA
jgi:hypothetical protein